MLIFLGVCLTVFPGCGRSGSNADNLIADRNKSNIQRLANLYGFYQAKHGWQGPADEAEFRKFISSQSATTLKRMGIDPNDLDSVFSSERDNEKFQIRWAVAGSERGEPVAVVFEQTGSGGERMIGFVGGSPREVDDAEYKKLFKE